MADTYYADHWKTIEPDRLARYEELFQFRPEQEPFIQALNLKSARRVLDFGCGPGFLAAEIARRTDARVTGADLNEDFISRARARKRTRGSAANLDFIHLADPDDLPQLGQFDRLICKNVLEYVPDAGATISSFRELLTPGGQVLLVDSDWGFVLVEPWGKAKTDDFFAAASGAFNERFIGRKLPGLLAANGFTDVRVNILAGADMKGRGIGVLTNMVSYIRQLGTMESHQAEGMLAELEPAVKAGAFLFVLPQFLVTATRPE